MNIERKLSTILEENQKQVKIVLIQGSARNEKSCAGQDSKTSKITKHIIDNKGDNVDIDYIDLSVKGDGVIVQPCKACISTAGGYHCHYPCDCYSKNGKIPDYMHNNDVYDRLLKCDGFMVITPVNWGLPSTQIKAFFDRLVCINLTLTVDEAADILGKDHLKDPSKTRVLNKSGEYNGLLINHYEGKYAAFFVHGDDGANDYREYAKKDKDNSPEFPRSFVEYANRSKGDKWDPSDAVADLVYQCTYSGIFVEDDCIDSIVTGRGIPYAENNDKIEKDAFDKALKVFNNLVKHITK